MGERVERTVRVWTKEQLLDAVKAGFARVFDREASSKEASLLSAHLWLETGGRVVANNFGNISAAGIYDGEERWTWSGNYWRPPWYVVQPASASERYKRLHAEMLAGKAPSAFRAYPSAEMGIDAYLSLLKRRYPGILAAAKDGDAEAFARAIRTELYTPGINTGAVAQSLESLEKDFGGGDTVERGKRGLGGLFAIAAGLGGAIWLTRKRR